MPLLDGTENNYALATRLSAIPDPYLLSLAVHHHRPGRPYLALPSPHAAVTAGPYLAFTLQM